MILTSAVLLCIGSLASAEMPGAEVFVAPNGNDANPGTLAKAFATLQRAQLAVRSQRAGDRGQRSEGRGQKPVIVNVREGTYYLPESLVFTSADSGSKAAPVVYQAYQNERSVGRHSEHRFVENIFEELDASGEWYLNAKTHTLYFYV